MERALVEEDPKFASTLRGTTLEKVTKRRALLAVVGLIIGIAVLMTGAVLRQTALGIAGFVLMLLSATVAVAALRSRNPLGGAATGVAHPSGELHMLQGGRRQRRSRNRGGGNLSQRMEERWRQRRDQSNPDY
jgi:Protein of unknown function (DUF3040)